MSKKCFVAGMIGAFLMASCSSQKSVVTTETISGEWDIVEVNGKTVESGNRPFIGFSSTGNRVYGNSGCNRINGSYTLEDGGDHIEFGQMGSTMMMCPDMDLETEVLQALSSVKTVKPSEEGDIALCKEDKSCAILLRKRYTVVPLEQIEGEWRIVEAMNQAVAAVEGGDVPCLVFNAKEKQVGGYAGCNRLNGAFVTEGDAENAISFPGMASTRMACPDMTTEQNVLAALEEARSYGIVEGGRLALFGKGSDIVMVLMRNL